jgi:triosephosphate isomerase
MKKKLIAGNWKMNGSLAANEALVQGAPCGAGATPACDVAVAVPSPYLAQVQGLLAGSASHWVRKDVSAFASGAYTGECRRPC